jgi:hypothetical protein
VLNSQPALTKSQVESTAFRSESDEVLSPGRTVKGYQDKNKSPGLFFIAGLALVMCGIDIYKNTVLEAQDVSVLVDAVIADFLAGICLVVALCHVLLIAWGPAFIYHCEICIVDGSKVVSTPHASS